MGDVGDAVGTPDVTASQNDVTVLFDRSNYTSKGNPFDEPGNPFSSTNPFQNDVAPATPTPTQQVDSNDGSNGPADGMSGVYSSGTDSGVADTAADSYRGLMQSGETSDDSSADERNMSSRGAKRTSIGRQGSEVVFVHGGGEREGETTGGGIEGQYHEVCNEMYDVDISDGQRKPAPWMTATPAGGQVKNGVSEGGTTYYRAVKQPTPDCHVTPMTSSDDGESLSEDDEDYSLFGFDKSLDNFVDPARTGYLAHKRYLVTSYCRYNKGKIVAVTFGVVLLAAIFLCVAFLVAGGLKDSYG